MELYELNEKLNNIILKSAIQIDSSELLKQMSTNGDIDLFDFGLDSLSMVYMVVEIENEFSLEFDLDELDLENLKKLKNLRECIFKKLN